MSYFVLTFVIVVLAMAGLAVGLMLGGRRLQGSCGGNAILKLCGLCKRVDGP